MKTTVREFVEGQIFKVQDHYAAKIRLMSHKHSERVASMRVAHVRTVEKVEKTCHEKFGTCEKTFEGKLIT